MRHGPLAYCCGSRLDSNKEYHWPRRTSPSVAIWLPRLRHSRRLLQLLAPVFRQLCFTFGPVYDHSQQLVLLASRTFLADYVTAREAGYRVRDGARIRRTEAVPARLFA